MLWQSWVRFKSNLMSLTKNFLVIIFVVSVICIQGVHCQLDISLSSNCDFFGEVALAAV